MSHQIGNFLYRGGGSEVLENLTERLTLSWSFQKVAFQKNKSVQLTRRDPLFVHLLAKSTSSIPRYFPCFTCCRKPVSMFVFCRASAGASTARILSLTYHFVFGFTFPICGSTLPQPKRNTKTTTQYT